MNEEKYYTPDISDLRVGYEFERCYITKKGTIWYKYAIKEHCLESGYSNGDYVESEIEKILREIKEDEIRTPFLTKEQIGGEGWEFLYEDAANSVIFTKDSRTLTFVQGGKEVIIRTLDFNYTFFKGSCPSVNELRYISKLLNIK